MFNFFKKLRYFFYRNSFPKIILIGSTVLLAIYIFLKLLIDPAFEKTFFTENIVTWITIGSIILGLFGFALNKFLINDYGGTKDYKKEGYYYDEINFELKELKDELGILKLRLQDKKNAINDDEILKTLSSKVDNYLNEDILKKIEERFGEKYQNEIKFNEIIRDVRSIQNRLDTYIVNLKTNSRLNLIIGVLTTFVAGFGLVYSAFTIDENIVGYENLLRYYIPRISAVIFIEVFAFFFLKLYRGNLEDIKYFQNEKTNIDFKILTLKMYLQNSNDEIFKQIVGEFLKTERNFKLGKDETTVVLRKKKLATCLIANC